MKPTTPDVAAEYAALFPDHGASPLLEAPALAERCGIARVFIKDEGTRPCGNFKILGGMLAALRLLARRIGANSIQELLDQGDRAALPILCCASDGNHGLAVAMAAQRSGAMARIFLPRGVGAQRAARIQACGAEIAWVDGTYDDAVDAASRAASAGDWLLVADTGTQVDDAVVQEVMAGYGLIVQELRSQLSMLDTLATHVFVQAGVGGLAAAVARGMRDIAVASARLLVVEPETADCVARALMEGKPVRVPGDLSTTAEMLSCGLASAPAIPVLRECGARAVSVSDLLLSAAVDLLRNEGLDTTPSGAASLAGLLHVVARRELRRAHALRHSSDVLIFVTERAGVKHSLRLANSLKPKPLRVSA
jgi:diaminopropionate ammonia-lyase